MMLHYFLPMILCIIVSYIGMFGYFKLFDDEEKQTTDVVAIATAPPSIVANTTHADETQGIVCVPIIMNDVETKPQQTQTCFSAMSKPP